MVVNARGSCGRVVSPRIQLNALVTLAFATTLDVKPRRHYPSDHVHQSNFSLRLCRSTGPESFDKAARNFRYFAYAIRLGAPNRQLYARFDL